MQEDKTKSRKFNMQLERQNKKSKRRDAGRQSEKTTCRTTKTKSRKDDMQDDKAKRRHAGRQKRKVEDDIQDDKNEKSKR